MEEFYTRCYNSAFALPVRLRMRNEVAALGINHVAGKGDDGEVDGGRT